MAAYRKAIMNDDIGKFGYDSCNKEQKKTKFKGST